MTDRRQVRVSQTFFDRLDELFPAEELRYLARREPGVSKVADFLGSLSNELKQDSLGESHVGSSASPAQTPWGVWPEVTVGLRETVPGA